MRKTPAGEQPSPLNNTIFFDFASSAFPGWDLIFTDGSKAETGTYVGVGVFHLNRNLPLLFKLNNHASIYTAESVALLKSLEYVSVNQISPCVIFSDSLSLVEKMNNPAISHRPTHIENSIRSLFRTVREGGGEVVLTWIPSHAGIAGNETADRLANEARSKGILLRVKIPASDLLPLIEEEMRNQWGKVWRSSYKIKGKHYSEINPLIPNKPWFYKKPFKRKEITSICRMRLGHCSAPAHLYRINILSSPECDCGFSSCTVDHLFFNCPLLNNFPSFIPNLVQMKIQLPTKVDILLASNSIKVYRIIGKFISLNQLSI